MNLVTLENITKQYSDRVLLDQVNLLINSGDRIGLIGPNGSGKSTLLRIIAGDEPTDSGQLTVWGGVKIQYLSQEPDMDDRLSVMEYIFQSDAPHIRLLRQYEETSLGLQADPTNRGLQQRLNKLAAEMDRTGGWAAEADAKEVLSRLGIRSFDAEIGTLSGGQRKRVSLAQALIAPTDLLILDEPTNHIDADTISWLEGYLMNRPGALLMVTHDRYFLGRVVNRIVELDRRELVNYPGNFGQYLEQRTKRHEQMAASEKKQQALLRRELEWLHRSPMARGTKQKARSQRVLELKELSRDLGEQRVAMALASRRLGKRVLEASQLSKRYDSLELFHDLEFNLDPGDRIGIIGPNGAGKSTLLDVLTGYTLPDRGTINWGSTVHLGYYDQQSRALQDDMKVHEFIESKASLIQTDDGNRIEAAQMLEWFLFTRPEQQAKIGSLSGGERRRLYMLYTLILQPNVLFLDEPTNDLDIQTLAVLEQFLDHFSGCLIVVSHDRYFLDRNVDFLFSFEDGVLGSRYPTPYENYRLLRDEARTHAVAESSSKATSSTPKGRSDRPRKLTWKERQELGDLETRIAELEGRIKRVESSINGVGDDFMRLNALAAELEQAQASLAQVEERWLELSEIADNE